VQQDGKVEHRQKALVEVAHLAVTGKEAECAASVIRALAGCSARGLGKLGIAGIGISGGR